MSSRFRHVVALEVNIGSRRSFPIVAVITENIRKNARCVVGHSERMLGWCGMCHGESDAEIESETEVSIVISGKI